MTSKEELRPGKYEFGPLEVAPVPVPGVTEVGVGPERRGCLPPSDLSVRIATQIAPAPRSAPAR